MAQTEYNRPARQRAPVSAARSAEKARPPGPVAQYQGSGIPFVTIGVP
jgi:hypothetical protein